MSTKKCTTKPLSDCSDQRPARTSMSLASLRGLVHLVLHEFPRISAEDCEDAVSAAIVYELETHADDEWRTRRILRKSLCNAYDMLRYYRRRPTCDVHELQEVLPSLTANTERQALARIAITTALASLQPRGRARLLAHTLTATAPKWGKANVSKIRGRLRQATIGDA